MKRSLASILLMTGVASAQAASVYKWTDSDGIVHYDDTQLVDSTKMTREYMDQRQIPASTTYTGPIPQAFIDDVQRRCNQARERVQNYRSANQLYGRTPDGIEYLLSPRQVALMVAETEQLEKRYCAANAAKTLFAQEAQLVAEPAPHPAKSSPARPKPQPQSKR